MKPISVNLLGGPGSGKSTLAYKLTGFLKEKGLNCEYVPEFAKKLVYGDNIKALHNQLFVLANQYYEMEILTKDVDIIVNDSPLFLSLYYNEYNNQRGSTFSQEAILKSVNACTAKFDNLNYFIFRNHPYSHVGRWQDEEGAKAAEKDIHDLLIKNEIDFKELISTDNNVDIIMKDLFKFMQMRGESEIERKFLLKNMPQDIEEHKHLVQGYISLDYPETRIRSVDNKNFYKTEKMGYGIERTEKEEEISQEEFLKMLPLCQGRIIEKTRYYYKLRGTMIEIDVYEGAHSGLKTAEVEFDSLEEANNFIPPKWFGKEITGKKEYKNSTLASVQEQQ